MSIGSTLKEVYEDLGTAFTIIRDSGDVTGEYLVYEINRQVTKPFIREFFLEAELAYDTEAVPGDVISFDSDNRTFLMMNKTPEQFENTAINHQCVLYKCNVSGELFRPSGELTRDAQYRLSPGWQTIKEDCYALETESLFGHDLETDEELGMIGLEKHELYIPSSIGARVHDRYQPVSGEYQRVETIKKRRFAAVDVCEMAQDNR